jgi:hypothetical protein
VSDVSSLLLAVLLPIVCMWAGATTVVTLAMVRLTSGGGRSRGGRGLPRLSAELWGATAASGAAAGGVLGLTTVAPALSLGAAAGALARLLTVAALGMLLGAALTAGLVLAAVWLWTGDG